MSTLAADLLAKANAVRALQRDGGDARPAEIELLRGLGSHMRHDESSFDPVHNTARILEATAARGEVRVTTKGEWKLGAAPEEDLLEVWGRPGLPTLTDVLRGVQEKFSSAKTGNLVSGMLEALEAA